MKKNTLNYIVLLCGVFFCACNKTVNKSSGSTLSDVPDLVDLWYAYDSGFISGQTIDTKIKSAWELGYTGSGQNLAILDDGLESTHELLVGNFSSTYSYNYVNDSHDPTPRSAYDGHGTCVSGIMAASYSSSTAIHGIAYNAKIAALNALQTSATADIADATTRNISSISVHNNSWGNQDTGYFFDADDTWSDAIEEGLTTGRNGKGTIYVWAAGNGGLMQATTGQYVVDRSLYDPYSSHYGVIAVCAVDQYGEHIFYSEEGANLWVCAPSGNLTNAGVSTTDLSGPTRGYNSNDGEEDYTNTNYTKNFAGTSAAAPVVSGVTSLILEANSNLGWEDVKLILAKSAYKNDASDTGWDTNGAGIDVHMSYGFGLINTTDAITLARSWQNITAIGPENYPELSNQTVNSAIPINGTEVSSTINVTGSNISKITYVEVSVNITHGDWGNLLIKVERDGGNIASELAAAHYCMNEAEAIIDCNVSTARTFVFGTARHLDEDPNGVWTLKVSDQRGDEGAGTLNSWRLRIRGY